MFDARVEVGVELLFCGDDTTHSFSNAVRQEECRFSSLVTSVEPVVMFHHLVICESGVELVFVSEAFHEMFVESR